MRMWCQKGYFDPSVEGCVKFKKEGETVYRTLTECKGNIPSWARGIQSVKVQEPRSSPNLVFWFVPSTFLHFVLLDNVGDMPVAGWHTFFLPITTTFTDGDRGESADGAVPLPWRCASYAFRVP